MPEETTTATAQQTSDAGTEATGGEQTGATGTTAADTGTQDTASTTTEGTEKPAESTATSTVPEKYELTLPDGSPLDGAALERTAATARELGLSQEAAQKLAESVSREVASQRDALLAAYQPGGAEWAKQVDAWKQEAVNDPALGKTPEERTATIQRGHGVVLKYAEQNPQDAQAMNAFLETSGLGNHPAAVRFFAWIGKAMGEGSMVMPSSQTSDASDRSEAAKARRLFPTMHEST